MKNFKKFIATILATTLTMGCVGSMNTFAGEPYVPDWNSLISTSDFRDVFNRIDKSSKHHDHEAVGPDSSGDLPVDKGVGHIYTFENT